MNIKNSDLKVRILSEMQRLSPDGVRAPSLKKLAQVGIKKHDIHSIWKPRGNESSYRIAIKEAKLEPNRFGSERISNDELFHLLVDLIRDPDIGRFPTRAHLTHAYKNKEGFPSPTTFNALGNKVEQIQKLLHWIAGKNEYRDITKILESDVSGQVRTLPHKDNNFLKVPDTAITLSDCYLPPVLACLSAMSRGSTAAATACSAEGRAINSEFEKRVAIGIELLGLSVEKLGQGLGRNPDGIGKCFGEHSNWAMIYDAKIRSSEYRLLTDDDRKFREYIERIGERLRKQGIGKYYFVVISSGFVDRDVPKARELCRLTYAKACILLEADALMCLVERRIRFPREFTMDNLERLLQETKILRASDVN
jgi:hypothetical protein